MKNTELEKLKRNIRCILECSNATPIGRYEDMGYKCCFCKKGFAQPENLKEHTLKEHLSMEKSTFAESLQLCNFIVKLDITGLQCTLCCATQDNLNDLISHLTTTHKKHYYRDQKDYFIPFKFDNQFQCIICQKQFTNFKILLMHMNEHYRNFVCAECGHGFVNSKTLLTHTYRHKKGEYKCTYCDKIFDTNIKCKDHERATHKMNNMRSKCGHCGERFSDYAKKNEHLFKKHGVVLPLLKCAACEKTFDNKRALTAHSKSYHSYENVRKAALE